MFFFVDKEWGRSHPAMTRTHPTPSSNGRECLKLHKGANSTNRVSVRFFYATRNQHKSQQILENQNMSGKDSE